MMLGLPTESVTAGVVSVGELCERPNIMPAAAPPPTAAAISSHLVFPPCDALNVPSPPACGTAVSLRYCVLTIPARAWSLIAVMRISIGPATLFHCIPETDARPSAPVLATSVRSPELNMPLGPESGSRKLTEAPGTGLPASSVTSTVIPRVARPPVR